MYFQISGLAAHVDVVAYLLAGVPFKARLRDRAIPDRMFFCVAHDQQYEFFV